MNTYPRKRVTKLPYARWRWTAEQRLAHYAKRDPVSGCQIWQGSAAPGGYGQLTFRSRSYLAHRLAWITTHGPIPPGLNVCHRCDERRCVNPDHLFLGSHSANMLDLRTKTRNWYASPAAETKHLPRPDTGFAPIRFRYRGIEFFGKVAVRVFDPIAARSLTALAPPADKGQQKRSQRRTARRNPPRRVGAAAKRGRRSN